MVEKRKILAEDLYKMRFVNDPQISPAGNEIVYTLTTVNDEKEYTSQLWLVDSRGENIQFTNTPKADTFPRWSPKGDQIAFVSTRSGSKQIWLVNRHGGEARQITHMRNGVSSPVWSPCGKKIAFLSSVGSDEDSNILLQEKTSEELDKESKSKGTQVRVNDNFPYKSDDSGFLKNQYSHLWVLDLESGQVERLTADKRDYMSPVWSPDGAQLLVGTDVDEPEYNVGKSRIILIDIHSRVIKDVLPEGFTASMSNWSPDGTKIAFIGHKGEYKGATLNRIWIIDLAEGSIRELAPDFDLGIGDYAMSDLRAGGTNPGPLWSFDGQSLYAKVSKRGDTNIYRIGLDDTVDQVIGDMGQIYGFTMDVDKQHIAFTFTNALIPGDIALFSLETGVTTVLTQVNETILAELELSVPEEFSFKGAEGWDIQGWVMKPIGFTEGQKCPLVLEIHGGPHAMYSNSFFHEFQLLAAHGYAVVYCNPRGSQGYGQKFVDAVRGDYGGNDYQDLMSCVDFALENWPWIDQERLGVTGGSYGGFMTNWIVSHTDRFKAAVTQRSITNWISFAGVSDIGFFFADWEHNLNFITDREELMRISPLSYVENVQTPLLIIHSEHDYRCPVEQAEQLFIALKQLRRTVRLSIFPGSNHNLSRNGKPELRVERLNQIAAWFDQYL